MTEIQRALHTLYSFTIDRSKFRETASRLVVFILPLIFWDETFRWEGLIFIFLGLAIRTWAAGYIKKDTLLTTTGPYRFFRHPLYLGSCLLGIGFLFILNNAVLTVVLGTVCTLMYWHTIRHEEKNLMIRFGQSYLEYCRFTGPLWPKLFGIKNYFHSRANPSHCSNFSFQQYMQNKEYECLLGTLLLVLIHYLI